MVNVQKSSDSAFPIGPPSHEIARTHSSFLFLSFQITAADPLIGTK
jgi:hypothetical protein